MSEETIAKQLETLAKAAPPPTPPPIHEAAIPSNLQFSTQQSNALLAAEQWLKSWYANTAGTPQVFKVFGYAGSGKTTIAVYFAKTIGRGVLAACFTGKAALVLQKKGFLASTIHSLIYKCEEVDVMDEKTGEPTGETELAFVLNHEDSPLLNAKLLIVDEVSMVNKELAEDLLSFGKPILVLGDPGQLPPITGTGYFTSGQPNIMLSEIHRQALDNPIIRMSLDIRTGKGIRKGKYGESEVVAKSNLDYQVDLLSTDQVICGLNRTRRNLNDRARIYRGFNQPNIPMDREKLICLKNNREKGFLNGSFWMPTAAPVLDGEYAEMNLTSLDMAGKTAKAKVPLEFFRGEEDKLPGAKRRGGDEFDFGYVITAHKSQGSQWDSVLVINENYCFREHAVKWLYTAVTRAAEKLKLAV